MESGTAETKHDDCQRGRRSQRGRGRGRADRGPQPGERRRWPERSTSPRPSRSPRPSPACAPTRPSWEALGNEGRYALARQAARLAARQPGADRWTRCRPRPARSAPEAAGEVALPDRPDQLLRDQGGQVHRRGNRPRAQPPARHPQAPRPVPALPRGRDHQPLELPAGARPRRRDPRPAGRRRGRRQALRVHPPRPRRSRQGLEGGDRRARRLRLRAWDAARPAPP